MTLEFKMILTATSVSTKATAKATTAAAASSEATAVTTAEASARLEAFSAGHLALLAHGSGALGDCGTGHEEGGLSGLLGISIELVSSLE